MKFNLSISVAVSALLAANVEALWKPQQGLTWDYLLGADESVIKASNMQVVTFDIDKAKSVVPYLHSKGKKAICYFSGGTSQEEKSDFGDYKKAGVVMFDTRSSWGNYYINIRDRSHLEPLLRARMERARNAGCDAIEVDSLGLYNHNVKDFTMEDSRVFGTWLGQLAHKVGISIGLKNVAGIAPALEPYFDFAVVESCADSNNVCDYYRSFTNKGKAVFMVHYEDGDPSYKLSSASSIKRIANEAGNRGYSCVLAYKNLKSHSTNISCNSGSVISGGSAPKVEQPVKKTTTTTIKRTTTTIKRTTTKKTVLPVKPVNTNPFNPIRSTKQSIKQNPVKTVKQIPVSNTTVKTIPFGFGSKTTPIVPGAQNHISTPSSKTLPGAQGTPVNPAVPGTPFNPAVPGAQTVPGTPVNPAVPGAQTVPGTPVNPAVPGAQTVPGTPVNPAVPGAQGNPVNPAVPGAQNATIPAQGAQVNPVVPGTRQPLNNNNNNNNEDNNESGNGVGAAVAVVAAGGVATAAVAGFIFLKKHKKFSFEKFDIGY